MRKRNKKLKTNYPKILNTGYQKYFLKTTEWETKNWTLLDCDRVKTVLEDDQIPVVPLLILANKIDKHAAAGEDEIRHVFGLHTLTTGKV